MSDPAESRTDGRALRSAFLPIFIVFLALLVGYGIQLVQVIIQNGELRRNNASTEQMLARVPVILSKLQSVNKDLVEAASTSPAAKQLLGEFGARPAQPAR
ncbi:MAG: hypothetical protein HUU04_08295 [Verrucomicrobiae bacterium]|nr:hypothetical protein [Verrucomicrobiae bacterium]